MLIFWTKLEFKEKNTQNGGSVHLPLELQKLLGRTLLMAYRGNLRKQIDVNLVQRIPEDGVDGENWIPADVRVSVLQTLSDGRHQRLNELWLLQLTQKPQCGAADKLIRVLQIL